jgi:hypothetical protein
MPPPPRRARARAGLAGVEERGQSRLLDDLVDRVDRAVVGHECLAARVELEAPGARLDLALRQLDRLGAARRVHGAEGNEDIRVVAGPFDDLHGGGPGRVLGRVLLVDRERHGRHLPLTVVSGQVIDGERGRRGLEVRGHRGEVLIVLGVGLRRVDRPVHVSVHVDRDQIVDVHVVIVRRCTSTRHGCPQQFR